MPKKTIKKIAKKNIKLVKLSIKRVNPDNIRSVPVNDILVNHSVNEFFITFSSLEPPQLLDAQEINNIKEIEAITRTKIVVSANFLETIIKTLNTNLETYKKNAEK